MFCTFHYINVHNGKLLLSLPCSWGQFDQQHGELLKFEQMNQNPFLDSYWFYLLQESHSKILQMFPNE